ncbi:hypothetical protein [Streptomyces boncukensis]|uniref:AG1 protein n=1 Tax=Streptomyces boncukensis TaxID=2711219 RepID=A0A6G4X685_9ACTN|nr:hypothetical protein [Streptomyces boncukensis]NGO72642.1 hypothetical protein [Streptomyces boncukensis]
MSFEDEWAECQKTANQRSTRMQLNQTPDGNYRPGRAPGGDLVVHDNELGAIGNEAYGLYQHLRTQGDEARPATFAAATAMTSSSLSLGSALYQVHDNWSTQLGSLKEACAHISNHLDYSQKRHKEDEARIATGMHTVSKLYDYFK